MAVGFELAQLLELVQVVNGAMHVDYEWAARAAAPS